MAVFLAVEDILLHGPWTSCYHEPDSGVTAATPCKHQNTGDMLLWNNCLQQSSCAISSCHLPQAYNKFSNFTDRHTDSVLQRQIKLKFTLQLGRYSWFENKIKCPQFPWKLIPVANCFLIFVPDVHSAEFWFQVLAPILPSPHHFPPSYHPYCPQNSPPPLNPLSGLGSWISPQEGIFSKPSPGSWPSSKMLQVYFMVFG